METLVFLLYIFLLGFVCSEPNFVYKGFLQSNLSLSGASYIRPDGILALTNDSSKLIGHAVYPFPLNFKESMVNNKSTVSTFSTNFVFSIVPKYPEYGGHGFAFVMMSTKEPKGCQTSQYLGLPNGSSSTNTSTKILALEFDTVQNIEFQDINDNDVGIDICSMISNVSAPATYCFANGSIDNASIILSSGEPIQAWIDYSSTEMVIDVSISSLGIGRPIRPLLSFPIDLATVLDEYMYVGFSASTGLLSSAHNVHGWSLRIGGKAQELNPDELPSLARSSGEALHTKGFKVGIAMASIILFLLLIIGSIHVFRRIRNEDELLEDWEVEYRALRFKYSELLSATRGFGEENLIGSGGFGRVYRAIIPSTGLEVAIKRIAQGSRQGMKEFVAEITSMGQLRHRNLVQLHGWCRKNDELLLVYDYVPLGSLDKLIFDDENQKSKILTWENRYKILTGVAQALLYLHEESNQRVIHRDVKPSNVLIDSDLNAKIGDFGLARMSEHERNPRTTHVVGTLGYIAPELTRTGKPTTTTDVYAYGILMLEVTSGRRAFEPENPEELLLVDWVRNLHFQENIIGAVDPSLEVYDTDEVKLALSLGLLCSSPNPETRPSMRSVVQLLLGDSCLPPLPLDFYSGVPRVTTEYSGSSTGDSDPSGSRMALSKSTSHSSSDKVSFTQGIRITL